MREQNLFENEHMFLQYIGKELGDIVIAAKLTHQNMDWLSRVTRATILIDRDMGPARLHFQDINESAEFGDYIINGGSAIYRPIDKELFEAAYSREQ